MFLEGVQIYLRTMEISDAEHLHRFFSNETVRKLTGTKKLFTKADLGRYIENSSQDSSRVNLLIVHKESNQPIGDIVLNSIDASNRNAGVRLALGSEEYFGKGYGTEALRLVMQYAFSVLNLHRVGLEVYSFNKRAIRSYEKVGFKVEGVQRDAVFVDYEFHDVVSMGLLVNDFREICGV